MAVERMLEGELLDLVFGAEGILARSYSSYEERPAQKAMAQQIFDAYDNGRIALVEGGTGTGKSLAYLAGAVLWAARNKERSVISTHTIALQHQLIEKDLPLLLSALDLDIEAIVVKGMNNYLCLKKLEEKEEQHALFAEDDEQTHKLRVFADSSTDGSKSSLSFSLPPGAWEGVAAERDSCTHVQCPHYKRCFFFKARKRAEDAQILIVNHHLLLLDCLDKKKNIEDERSILPEYTHLVVDEAHHLEDIALDILAIRSSKRELFSLLARLVSEREGQLGSLQRLRRLLVKYDMATSSLLHRLDTEFPQLKIEIATKIASAFTILESSQKQLLAKKWRLQKEDLQENKVVEAFDALVEDLKKGIAILRGLVGDLPSIRDEKQLPSLSAEVLQAADRIEEKTEALTRFFHPDEKKGSEVRWFERENENHASIVCADLDVAGHLSDKLFSPLHSAVLCSATLGGGGDFSLIKNRLGISLLEERVVTEGVYPSPFDFASRVLFGIPSDLPDPASFPFTKEASDTLYEILSIVEGGCFVLFTSYEMLQQFHRELQPRLKGFSLFRQGDEERTLLLQRFRTASKGVLFGTDSFWEGVDIAGEALRCVVIVKLPFQVPNDPVVEAQHEAITKAGGNPFYDLTVPKAAMKFKQGFGRLMRTKDDRGCVICLDPRLLSKSYGKKIIAVLPSCRNSFSDRTTVLSHLRNFFGK